MINKIDRVIIVANGRPWKGIVDEIHHGDFVIGVDRAAYWLLQHGVVSQVAIGDFDSVNSAELAVIQQKIPDVRAYPAEKDFIDTELALDEAFRKKPKEILILGASGTRRDHEMAVIGLLERCLRRGVHAVIRDQTNDVTIVGRGRTILEGRAGMRYVSVLPITKSIVISLSKFKYKIVKKRISRGQTIGISNEFIDAKAIVDTHRGAALVIQSRD